MEELLSQLDPSNKLAPQPNAISPVYPAFREYSRRLCRL
jgi:hypothetical protein